MPVRDFECLTCQAVEADVYMRRSDDPAPPCPACGSERKTLVSRFGVPFSGSFKKYSDPKKEGADVDGYWAYRKRSSISGQMEPVYLDSMQAVAEFNRAEGLSAPGEVPTNATISPDGKRILSDGMPGQWRGGGGGSLNALIPSGVWEMNTSMTSLKGKAPEPQSSGPPCTVQVADASLMDQFTAGG